MDTETKQSHELSPQLASAPVAVGSQTFLSGEALVGASSAAAVAVRSADGVADPSFGGPLEGSIDGAEFPVCSPDLWEVTAREGCEWEFSRDGLRAVRRVNLGELLALLGAEVQVDEVSGAVTDEVHAKTGVLKGARKLRLGLWDNMKRRWDAVVDNDVIFTVRLELYHNDEAGVFSVCVPRVVEGYELRLEAAFRKREGLQND